MLKNKLPQINLSKGEKIYFGFLIIVVTLPIIAPILSSLGFHSISKNIYFLYSFFCHQFDTRSIHIHDYQYAWCARDTGIWIGILTASICYYKKFLPRIKWYYMLIFIIPIAMDGGIQTLSTFGNIDINGGLSAEVFYVSNNFFRFVTGSWFGLGVGLWISQYFLDIDDESEAFSLKIDTRSLFKVTGFLIIVYVSMIGIWGISSQNYKPTNVIDSEPKIQRDNFFQRRAHGECPNETTEDLLNLDCFF